MNKDRKEKARNAPKGMEGINVGFATDCSNSGFQLLIEETGKIIIFNQAGLMRIYTRIEIVIWLISSSMVLHRLTF